MSRHRSLSGSPSGRLAAGLLVASLLTTGLTPAVAETRLPGLRGGQLTDADLARGSVIVVVWASWSPRCREIVERVHQIESRWGGSARVVTVDFQEDAADVEEFLRGKSLKAPVFLDRDGEFSKAVAMTSLPWLVVYRDGAERYRGRLPEDAEGVIGEALR